MNSPQPAPAPPLPSQPSYEVLEDGEAQTCEQSIHTVLGISETTFKGSNRRAPADRIDHAGTQGRVRAFRKIPRRP